MRKSNIGKIGLIISTAINVILFILSVIYKTNNIYDFYWISIMLLILFEIYFILQVDKCLNDHDNNIKSIRRIYDDSSMACLFMFFALFTTILALNQFTEFDKNNIYIIVIMFVMTLANLWILYASISNANKETSKLLNNIK
ncbi:MAG: hypothetical protein Q4E39_04445 [bacterium]|nr:hypothetical protein [bacterium]